MKVAHGGRSVGKCVTNRFFLNLDDVNFFRINSIINMLIMEEGERDVSNLVYSVCFKSDIPKIVMSCPNLETLTNLTVCHLF